MGKAAPKLVLSRAQDIPFDRLVLSQSNVRSINCGVSIGALAADIARRTLLQSLNVRPVLDETGAETGMFEVPAGGRRFRALQLLIKQKKFAKDGPVPCVVRLVSGDEAPSAEEDSLAENLFRQQLHPLDQFRAMQTLADQGSAIDDIAARFMTTPAVVRQRLKLASVSPALCEIYAGDGMTLEQLMAFSVSDDHARQTQVWEIVSKGHDRSPHAIRRRLTEDSVRATDRRVLFVGLDAYLAAGGTVMRDLFEEDRGGWLQDVGLLDQLVMDKLGAEGERIGQEGWKWVAVALDFTYGHADEMLRIDGFDVPLDSGEQARLDALEAEIAAIEAEWGRTSDVPDEINQRYVAAQREMRAIGQRPIAFDPADIAKAGVFVSLDHDGTLDIERGFVRPDDEPEAVGAAEGGGKGDEAGNDDARGDRPTAAVTVGGASVSPAEEEDDDVVRPLPDRLVTELTVHRTLALGNALAANPSVAFHAVLHAMVLSVFYHASRESCLGLSLVRPQFMHQEPGLSACPSAIALDARAEHWKSILPRDEGDLWEALIALSAEDQAALFAHCVSKAVNAVWEACGRYDNGRISPATIERRIAHSNVLARAVGLDMVAAGWTPTVDRYLGRVTKPRILAAVADALGAEKAGLIAHLKKGDMAQQAERLLDGSGWLPEPLRTPGDAGGDAGDPAGDDGAADDPAELPAFLANDDDVVPAVAAE
jgi:ParB family chromosome partitioning protein